MIISTPLSVADGGSGSCVMCLLYCAVGRVTLVIGHWSLVVGHWSLVVGRWSLDVGRGS